MKGKSLKVGWKVILVVVMLMTLLMGCYPTENLTHKELKLAAAEGDWAELPKRVTKNLLKDELGYVVIVRDAAANTAWSALAEGELDIFTDVWFPNQENYTNNLVPEQVRIAGDLDDPATGLYTNADQGWLIPKWTRDKYNIDSLDDVATLVLGDALFDTLDVDGDGLIELLGGELGWAVTEINDKKIDYYNENYDLDMKQLVVTHAGGHSEMLATIKNKLDAQEDILFYLWTPHHLFNEYADALSDEDGQILWLEDPWGFYLEPEAVDYYTGFPSATIYIAYRAGLENEHPEVIDLLERIRMTITDLNTYCYWENINKGGKVTAKEKDEYVRTWIEDNRIEVDRWLAGR